MNPADYLRKIEQQYNLPEGYLARTRQIESRNGQNTYNPKSGAAGDFQFIPSTAKAYGLSDPYDFHQSADAAGRFARDNANVLRNRLGRDPSAGELYLAHQQGAGGASKLLANPDAPAGQLLGTKAVAWNGGDPNAPASQFAAKWLAKFSDGSTPATPQAQANSTVTPDTTNVPGFMKDPMDNEGALRKIASDDIRGLLDLFEPGEIKPKTPDEPVQAPTLTPSGPTPATTTMLSEMLKPRRLRGLL